MAIELCVFDVAGTTVEDDDAVLKALTETVLRHGLKPRRADITRVMGLPKPAALRALLSASAPALEARVAQAHDEFERRMLQHYTLDERVWPIDGAFDAFRALRASGVRVALDTGFSRRILDAILHRLGWLEGVVVDATITSDEVPRGRPFPDMIHRAMHVLEIDEPRSVCKVGDTAFDMREGRAAEAGLVVGVLTGTGTERELFDAGADIVVGSIVELAAMLVGQGRGAQRQPARAWAASERPLHRRVI